jgi:serine/threonine protein kinase
VTDLKLLQCRLDGRYDIEECLGRGSYAEIYMARDRGATDEAFRKVVIKALNVLLQGYQDPDLERTLIQNFQNEAVALDLVRHPNVISRLGHGTAIDLTGTAFHYLVLEYLGGGDMAMLCRREPLKVDRALFYLKQICAGLAHAHAGGVIHRDIKPQNLLLTADHETVKIADFGVARLGSADGAITRVGTNIYAAPEHNPTVQTSALGTGALAQLTPAADIYSLAKTAYTLLTGTGPRAFAHEPITTLPAPLSVESWAPSIARVIERATQTRASDRYQTVQDFWDELHEAALPATQPLIYGRPRPVTADLSVEAEVLTEAAPPRPRFETSKELQQPQAGNGASRPRIVVPIAERPATTVSPGFSLPAPHPGGRVTVSVPSNQMANGVTSGLVPGLARAQTGAGAVVARPRKRSRDFVVGLVLVLCFAGLLLATGAYVRSLIKGQPIQQTITPSIVGHEAVTTTDLNLRSGPNAANDQIGLAESGSRVRVLSVSSNPSWCEVQVLQHSRPKDDQDSADRGWVNKRFLKFD